MPKKSGKSSFAAKVGAKGKKAFDSHKSDDTRLQSGGDLPSGIDNGVAQVVECKFDTYKSGPNEGEYYFLASAVVVTPKVHQGIPIAGQRTQIGPEPICDTPQSLGKKKTIDDHLDWVCNELRKLGVPTKEIDFDTIEDVAAAIKEEAPHILFRTWQGKPSEAFPNPRVNHDWRGIVEDYDESAEPAATTVDDDSEESDDSEPPWSKDDELASLAVRADADDEEAAEAIAVKAKEAGVDHEAHDSWAEVVAAIEAGGEGEAEGEEDADDAGGLGGLADEGDEDAIAKLTEQAETESVDPDDFDTWAELEATLGGSGGDNGEAGAGDDPEKGDHFMFRPPRARKPVEVTLTSVNVKQETAMAQDANGKVHKSVPWDKLTELED